MRFKRPTVTIALTAALLLTAPLQAKTSSVVESPVFAQVTVQLLGPLSVLNPASMLEQPANLLAGTKTAQTSLTPAEVATVDAADVSTEGTSRAPSTDTGSVTDLRKALIAMAMKLRDIRYVRGGHDPATGFDCSGFVRYVFAHAVGMQLPTNSASQFLAGLKVKRADMKPGDLVFFHTHGKSRISHVGIYIADGRFIHSPTSGKSVQVSSLDETYWAKHFAGAKRPEAMAMAMVAHNG